MNQTLRGALVTVVMTALLVFILLLGASGIAYMSDDPDSMLFPLSLAVQLVCGIAAGVLSVRMISGNPLAGGMIGAGILLLLIAAASVFFRSGVPINWLRVLITVVIAAASSLVGAYIAQPRAADPAKRRKHLERRYVS
ncbi:MAG: YrzE family protein [Clostridia bacterium]|nr:YrzE family protein [Clostridia bacterium]